MLLCCELKKRKHFARKIYRMFQSLLIHSYFLLNLALVILFSVSYGIIRPYSFHSELPESSSGEEPSIKTASLFVVSRALCDLRSLWFG